MRILIDESLPKRIKRELSDHDVSTVQEMNWSSKENGELLRLISGSFDVFITNDQNLPYQQNLRNPSFALIVLVAINSKLETLKPLIPQVQAALQSIQPGDVITIT